MKKSIKVIVFLTVFVFTVGFNGASLVSAKAVKGIAKAGAQKAATYKKVETKKVVTKKTETKTVKSEDSKNAKGKDKKVLPPVIKEGRLLIPVNAITKSLGAEVKWSQEEGKVTISKNGVTIVIDLKTMVAAVNGKEYKLNEISDKSSSGRIVPIRFIAQQLGVKLSDKDEKDITNTTDQTSNTENSTTDQTSSTGSSTSDQTSSTGSSATDTTTQQ